MTGETNFIWTEEGYQNREYCYYCKATFSHAEIKANGYGCSNCKNYADINGTSSYSS